MSYHSFSELIDRQSEIDKIFLIQPEDGESLTYAGVKEEARRLQALLLELGMKKGERVAVALANGITAGVSILGVLYAGGVVVPVNLGWKQKEITYVLEDSDCRFLVSTQEILDVANVQLITHGEKQFRDATLWELKGSFENPAQAQPSDGLELALILYTSGTTGKPKGVMLTHENLLAEAEYVRDGHGLTKKDVSLQVLPLFHVNGLVIAFLTPFVTGCTLVIPKKFSVSHFWEWIEKYEVTWLSAVPTIISMVLSRTPAKYQGAKSLRFVRSASAPLPVAVLDEFEQRFHVPIVESFGISEGASQITTNPVEGVRKAGSVGLPVGNVVEVVLENGEKAATGEIGEVRIKGDNIFAGYYNNPEETANSLRDGWFYAGDLGWLDQDGYLFLKGRKKELINRAGEKFSPREIDEVLYQIKGVELAAAVGVPDPIYNEEVVAYVKLRDGVRLTEREIIAFCKERISDFKAPKKVFFTDDFPKGPSGKIQRLKFVDRYLAQTQKEALTEKGEDDTAMEKVTVDFQACKECGYCAQVCPKGVFAKGKEYNGRGYQAYEAVKPAECIGCERCFYACPDFAISLSHRRSS